MPRIVLWLALGRFLTPAGLPRPGRQAVLARRGQQKGVWILPINKTDLSRSVGRFSEQSIFTSERYLSQYDLAFNANVDHKKTFSRCLQPSAQNVFGGSTDTAKARMDSDSS